MSDLGDKIKIGLISGVIILSVVGTGYTIVKKLSGNRQIFDFDKSFNVAIEQNDDNVSIVGIKNYADYDGSQIQFKTQDNLLVLTSTHQTQLVKTDSSDKLNNLALSLSNDKEENIVEYDKLQGTEINFNKDSFNKDVLDFNPTFNKAIIVSDDNATIIEISSWRDYDEDDKIQIKTTDGMTILADTDKVKLVNDTNANEDSVKNYAKTLVGSEENITYYNSNKTKTK